MAADIDERQREGEAPEAYARRMAIEKAAAVRPQAGDRPVLGADTIVVAGGVVLGKPVDDADATRMLQALSGTSHEAMTAVALWWPRASAPDVALERARVWMREIAPEEIAAAVATGQLQDKAGAYAIQGLASRWITRIEGAPGTVVGLPVETVDRLLRLRASGAYSVSRDEG
jgi:septum formation protein